MGLKDEARDRLEKLFSSILNAIDADGATQFAVSIFNPNVFGIEDHGDRFVEINVRLDHSHLPVNGD